MKFQISLATVFNGMALALIFPWSLLTIMSIKFYVVIALMAAAVTAAEYNGAKRAKNGEL